MSFLRRISSGGVLALAVNALLALTALGIAFAAPGGGDGPQMRLAAADGSLSLVNSKEGEAIFSAGALRPGQQAAGTVQLTNSGSVAGALAVARTAAAMETPGTGGGLLSTRLQLRVFDVTQASAPVQLWSGALAGMPPLGVGSIPAGEQRSYRFVATMPSGTGDNAFQGAQLSVGFTWTAVGSSATPTPTPTATPTPSATPTPLPATPTPAPTTPPGSGGGGAGADPTGEVLGSQLFALPAATNRCISRRRFKIHIRRPRGIVFKSVKITVNRKTKLKLKGLKARKIKARVSLRGLPRGKVVVRVVAVTTTGRKAVSKRTYRTCAKKPVKKKPKRKKRKR